MQTLSTRLARSVSPAIIADVLDDISELKGQIRAKQQELATYSAFVRGRTLEMKRETERLIGEKTRLDAQINSAKHYATLRRSELEKAEAFIAQRK